MIKLRIRRPPLVMTCVLPTRLYARRTITISFRARSRHAARTRESIRSATAHRRSRSRYWRLPKSFASHVPGLPDSLSGSIVGRRGLRVNGLKVAIRSAVRRWDRSRGREPERDDHGVRRHVRRPLETVRDGLGPEAPRATGHFTGCVARLCVAHNHASLRKAPTISDRPSTVTNTPNASRKVGPESRSATSAPSHAPMVAVTASTRAAPKLTCPWR